VPSLPELRLRLTISQARLMPAANTNILLSVA
jgi:hypothetical protein